MMLPDNNEYKNLIEAIKDKVRQAQYRAMVKANGEMIQMYWSIGKMLNEQARYGNSFIDTLAQEIRIDSPQLKGFSARNLRYMKKFAKEITDDDFLQTVSAKLTWSHNLVLIEKLHSMEDRWWYGRKTIENAWSVDLLELQIAGKLMERQNNTNKIQNFALRLPEPQSDLAIQTMKDPYIFDFVELREGMIERDVEDELVNHITSFLLEMGSGFAFMGRQKLLKLENDEFFPDLLFYNTILRCYVVIDLKMKKFIPEYAGKMNFYLSLVDDKLRSEGDNPSIGLILCRDRNRVVAEYSLRDMSKPIGVSEYKLTQEIPEEFRKALPDAEAWEKHLNLPIEQANDDASNLQTASANLGSEPDKAVNADQNVGNDEALPTDTAQKVGSESKKMGSTAQKTGSDFAKYEEMLVKAGITKIFIMNIENIFQHAGQNAFKQSDVMEYLGCSKSKAGNVMNAMRKAGVIRKVTGMGLGKYQFV